MSANSRFGHNQTREQHHKESDFALWISHTESRAIRSAYSRFGPSRPERRRRKKEEKWSAQDQEEYRNKFGATPLQNKPDYAQLKTRVLPATDTQPAIVFDSRFEGATLQRAYRLNEGEYCLILNDDYGTNQCAQWFYFSVQTRRSGMASICLDYPRFSRKIQ